MDLDQAMAQVAQTFQCRRPKVFEVLKDMEEQNSGNSIEMETQKERLLLEGDITEESIEAAIKVLQREGD